MPRIQWTGLPPALRDHLFDRLRERKITAVDLYQLKTWRESEPDAPDGLWYKPSLTPFAYDDLWATFPFLQIITALAVA